MVGMTNWSKRCDDVIAIASTQRIAVSVYGIRPKAVSDIRR